MAKGCKQESACIAVEKGVSEDMFCISILMMYMDVFMQAFVVLHKTGESYSSESVSIIGSFLANFGGWVLKIIYLSTSIL